MHCLFFLKYISAKFKSWRLSTHWLDPNIRLMCSTSKNIESIASAIFLIKFDHAFNLDLVHASFFFFAVNIACWLKYASKWRLHSWRIAWGVYTLFTLPIASVDNNFVSLCFLMQSYCTFMIRRPDTELLTRTHTQRQNISTSVVNNVFIALFVLFSVTSIFIKNLGVFFISIVNANYSMTPSSAHYTVSLCNQTVRLFELLVLF